MTTGQNTCLVDTNVLVYMFDPRDEAKQARALDVTNRIVTTGLGVLSVQVLSEFFVNVTRKLPVPLTAAEAEHEVTNFARSWTVFNVTPLAVLEAVRGVQRHRLSYYDALIWAVAKLNGAPNLISEDFQHGALVEGVRFSNPFSPGFDIDQLVPH